MKHHPKQSAFTLVELAIVLVIIGLIVGGVLVGRDLIRIAQLQAVISEKERITAALFTFRAKYNALAGDMSNAHQYFGDDCGTNTTDINTGCNGNGDGFINVEARGETHKAWEHLSRGGLVKGEFTGSGTLDGTMIVHSPTNVPSARYPNGYWSLTNQAADMATNAGNDANAIYLEFGHIHHWGQSTGDVSGELNPILDLTNGEALRVDLKADDGAANTGAIRGDNRGDCFDYDPNHSDYYSIVTAGRDTVGMCMFHFIL